MYSFVILLENVVSSIKIKKCHRFSVTSMRSGKFPRLRFSAKCLSWHHVLLHSTFWLCSKRIKTICCNILSLFLPHVNGWFYMTLPTSSASLDQSDRIASRITLFVLLKINLEPRTVFCYIEELGYQYPATTSSLHWLSWWIF